MCNTQTHGRSRDMIQTTGSGDKWSDKIVTVINGMDIIPRASLANMFCLLMQVLWIELRLKCFQTVNTVCALI